jgi:plasmid stability protein
VLGHNKEGHAMSLIIDLPEDQTAALAAKARSRGLSTEEYAREVLLHDLAPDWLRVSWASSKAVGLDQLSMEEIDAEIAAARRNRRESPPRPGA